MVLGKLAVPGRPTIWITVGQGPTALTVGASGGCLDIFTLIYHFSPLSPSLWETARYRLKYCLKGPLNPKQPTNQLFRKQQARHPSCRNTSHSKLVRHNILSCTIRNTKVFRNIFNSNPSIFKTVFLNFSHFIRNSHWSAFSLVTFGSVSPFLKAIHPLRNGTFRYTGVSINCV